MITNVILTEKRVENNGSLWERKDRYGKFRPMILAGYVSMVVSLGGMYFLAVVRRKAKYSCQWGDG